MERPGTKRLTRSGYSLALVIDKPLLEALGIDADPDALFDLVDGAATGRVDKAAVAVFLRRHAVER